MTVSEKTERRQRVQNVLILVIIILSVALIIAISVIIVWSRSTSSDLNNKDRTIITALEIRTQKSAPCEDDWIRHRGKCYYFSTEKKTWEDSEKFCHSHESSLAIIDNKEELDFLFQRMCTDNHWIGVRRTDDNTGWTWTNGSLYNENLFNITRLSEHSGETEYVFLNNKGVKSQQGKIHQKWICTRK